MGDLEVVVLCCGNLEQTIERGPSLVIIFGLILESLTLTEFCTSAAKILQYVNICQFYCRNL